MKITASEIASMAQPEVEISPEQMEVLEQLVDCVPWFSCAQLLLLKAMKQQQHPFFDVRLAYASLYATNREHLQEYLQKVKVCDTAEAPLADTVYIGVADDDKFELLPFDELSEAGA
jgi:hypothetical protein